MSATAAGRSQTAEAAPEGKKEMKLSAPAPDKTRIITASTHLDMAMGDLRSVCSSSMVSPGGADQGLREEMLLHGPEEDGDVDALLGSEEEEEANKSQEEVEQAQYTAANFTVNVIESCSDETSFEATERAGFLAAPSWTSSCPSSSNSPGPGGQGPKSSEEIKNWLFADLAFHAEQDAAYFVRTREVECEPDFVPGGSPTDQLGFGLGLGLGGSGGYPSEAASPPTPPPAVLGEGAGAAPTAGEASAEAFRGTYRSAMRRAPSHFGSSAASAGAAKSLGGDHLPFHARAFALAEATPGIAAASAAATGLVPRVGSPAWSLRQALRGGVPVTAGSVAGAATRH